MKQFAYLSVAALVMGLIASAPPAYSCSGPDLTQKQRAFSDAVKAAFERDPGGDAARQAQVQVVFGRYKGLMTASNGSSAIDMLCKENDELLAIYK